MGSPRVNPWAGRTWHVEGEAGKCRRGGGPGQVIQAVGEAWRGLKQAGSSRISKHVPHCPLGNLPSHRRSPTLNLTDLFPGTEKKKL